MSYFVFKFPGVTIPLSRYIAPDATTEIVDSIVFVFEIFQEIVEPLAIEAQLGIVDRELGIPDYTRSRESVVVADQTRPSHVVLPVWVDPPTIASVEELRPPAIRRWLEQMLASVDPSSVEQSHVATILTLWTLATRMRLVGDRLADPWPLLTPAAVEVPVPLETRGQEHWVSGPITTTPTQPPVSLSLGYDKALFLRISRHWSTWAEDPVADLIEGAVNKLVAAGWERSDDDDENEK